MENTKGYNRTFLSPMLAGYTCCIMRIYNMHLEGLSRDDSIDHGDAFLFDFD